MHFTSYNLASEKITRLSYMVSDIANAIESGQTIMGIFLDPGIQIPKRCSVYRSTS